MHTDPVDVARRIATGATEPGRPVIVTDNAGRYVGLITLRRLLSDVADRTVRAPTG